MKIFWTKHAEERQKEWEIRLGIKRQEVENVLRNPQQIVSGEEDALIAQTIRNNGLLRVVYIEIEDGRKILTLYWTSKIDRYWELRCNEDEI